jgi:phosphoglycolate phosphatase-like HAD superfamily hydrolase
MARQCSGREARCVSRARAGGYTRATMLQSFRQLAENYSTIFFDAYGVLKNFEGVLDGALDVLATLKSAGKELFIVTNDASRSPKKMAQSYVTPELGELFPRTA